MPPRLYPLTPSCVLYIGIPTYNEATTIGVLLWRLRTVLADVSREYEVVVYDDASTDDTAATLAPYARVLPLTVLQGARRLGTGGAMDALVRHVARTTRYPRRDGLLLLQGDFTDPPAIVPEFLRRFEGGADLVIGERLPVADAPQPVRRLHRAARWVLRPFVGITDVKDLTASIRLARISVLRDLLKGVGDAPVASGDGWAAQADFLLRAAPHARRIETIPVTPTFGVRTRASRREAWPDALALAKWGWANRGRRVEAKVVARTVDAPADVHEPIEELDTARPVPSERRERTSDASETTARRTRRERDQRGDSGDGPVGERERERAGRSRSERTRSERTRNDRSERASRTDRTAATLPVDEPSSARPELGTAAETEAPEAPNRKKRRRSRRSGRGGEDGAGRDSELNAQSTDAPVVEAEARPARPAERPTAPAPAATSSVPSDSVAGEGSTAGDAFAGHTSEADESPADEGDAADRPRARRRRARRGRRRRAEGGSEPEGAPREDTGEHASADAPHRDVATPPDRGDVPPATARRPRAERDERDERGDEADEAPGDANDGESGEAARARRRRNRRGRRGGRRRQGGDGPTGDVADGDRPSGDASGGVAPRGEHDQ